MFVNHIVLLEKTTKFIAVAPHPSFGRSAGTRYRYNLIHVVHSTNFL